MQSVLSTLRVLEEVARQQPVGVSEIARLTGMPKSSVQRCVVTLQCAGWLRVLDSERARWGVTPKLLAIGLRGSGQDGLREAAGPVIADLRQILNETIHLAVLDGSSLVIIAREDCTQTIRTYVELGSRAPLHGTACGLAILARLSEIEVEEFLKGDLESYSPTTITNAAQLREEIVQTRDRGYSLNLAGWWRAEVAAVGTAIVRPSGRPVAGLAISVPSSRFNPDDIQRLANAAMEAADQISARLEAY
jgi:DNA-binding IclR family transcriptional regulator